MKYLLIACGCAECRHLQTEPLIEMVGPFDTLDEAKGDAWTGSRPAEWIEHPQGGVFNATGQGDCWILPVPDNFTVKPIEEEPKE